MFEARKDYRVKADVDQSPNCLLYSLAWGTLGVLGNFEKEFFEAL